MNPSAVKAPSRFAPSQELVSSDFMALASHMSECERSRGRFFTLHAVLETLHAVTAPRLVTTGALLVVCSLGLVLLTLA